MNIKTIYFKNNKVSIDKNGNELVVENSIDNIQNKESIVNFTKSDYFIGDIIDFFIILNVNVINQYKYLYIYDFIKNKRFIFENSLKLDFLFKLCYNHKLKRLFDYILKNKIYNYSTNIENLDSSITKKISINTINNNEILEYDGKRSNLPVTLSVLDDYHIIDLPSRIENKISKFDTSLIKKLEGQIGLGEKFKSSKISDLYYYSMVLHPFNFAYYNRGEPVVTGGIAKDRDLSITKGFAECIERYSSGELVKDHFPIVNNLPNQSRKLPFNVGLKQDSFKGYRIYKIHNITKESINLEREKYLLPTEYVTYINDSNYTNNLGSSNGIATHANYYNAIINSYNELLERDSIALTWTKKITPKQIVDTECIFKDYIDYIKNEYNFNISFYDISLDKKINVILCVGINTTPKTPYFFASSSTNVNAVNAMEKALFELMNIIRGFFENKDNFLNDFNNKKKSINEGKLNSTLDHIYYYIQPNNFKKIGFLFENNASVTVADLPNYSLSQYEEIINQDDLYIANLTTKVGKSIGLYTVKVFSTKYINLWFGNGKVPIQELNSRFESIEKELAEKGIFSDSVYKKYHNKETQHIHFLG